MTSDASVRGASRPVADDSDRSGSTDGRDETPQERADRVWIEMLQEVRVSQTGAQILFGFLISVAFTPRFAALATFDRNLYVATVVLGAIATGSLVAPVAFHRFLAGRDMKPELIHVAGRLISVGLVTLPLTITAALLLLLRTATGDPAVAWGLSGCVLLWFTTTWLLLPQLVLRRAAARQRGTGPGGAEAARRDRTAAGRRSGR
ncbi:hypothetical protein GCM10010495_78980 [Kitasatospora herbaricolor]|uniref:DUF6328 family protein n=1 Tax=Kitasatospora herbaricolor TaxID=68217 RepID=UPI0019AE1CF7|nr:DUF6328 family protein [Kitasatospora herbaricolor]MDQ0306168.1 hypothetical protein [Kitasatospora herbaricolor]GGV49448.1 hypothetical protein GCM10010495_78980 [Kitasatospora herbaricolor]